MSFVIGQFDYFGFGRCGFVRKNISKQHLFSNLGSSLKVARYLQNISYDSNAPKRKIM